jgi:OPT family oligopeptide transporter
LPLLDNSNNDEQSPYEEVAANISNKDDPTMLCLTFRSVFIGIFLTCLTSFTSQFFAYRTSPLAINTGIVILLSYMIGQFVSKTVPKKIFNITLNPGQFSAKEHALITIMATSGGNTISAIETITVQRLYYNYYLDHLNGILFIIIMHLLSFSIAGILKRYLVWPASMIWPDTLLSCGLIRTLTMENDLKETGSKWTMTRSRFFSLIVLLQFGYYWLPGYIFPLLSFFSLICMIAPHKITFSQITGANGLGIGAIELDWNAWVAYLGSPILVPFW